MPNQLVFWLNLLGWVTPAKAQGSCQSCCAFAAGAAAEICLVKSGATLATMNLSEQWMMNCGYNPPGIKGCKGAGSPDYFKYLISVKPSLVHENTLGYLAMNVSTALSNKFSLLGW